MIDPPRPDRATPGADLPGMRWSRRRPGRDRDGRGLTLIELLVVISIVSLLIGLLIPAVLGVRGSSRRLECVNHLKQVELATQSYHDTYNAYPGYFRPATSGPTVSSRPRLYSVFSRILPYLDQAATYAMVNFSAPLDDPALSSLIAYTPPPGGLLADSLANATATAVLLDVLLCPADPMRGPSGATAGTNYRANYGSLPNPNLREQLCGPFAFRQAASARDVTDGLSQTAAYSEKLRGDSARASFSAFSDAVVAPVNVDPPPPGPFSYCANQPLTPGNYRTGMGTIWLVGGLSQTCYNHLEVPNGPAVDCLLPGYHPAIARASARSAHGSGVNVAMADGSVRFVAASIGLPVWQAMGTRAGGESY